MVEGALDHRLGTGLAIFFLQIFLEAAGVDPDADGAAMILGRLDHLAHPAGAADIAGIDAQAGGPGLGRLDRPLVVKVDVGNDRDGDLRDDPLQRRGRFLVGAGHPDYIDPGLLELVDLADGRRDVGGERGRHRLDGDRGVTADRDPANMDLAGGAPVDIAIGPKAHGKTVNDCLTAGL